VATERSEHAKAQTLAGYPDPGARHLNCAQAVMLSGLLVMDEDPALTGIAGHLGGGMVRMGQICGALSGAAVTVGLRDSPAALDQPGNSSAAFDLLPAAWACHRMNELLDGSRSGCVCQVVQKLVTV